MKTSSQVKVLVVVPLRLASTRLPQKILKVIGKQSLAEHTLSRALEVAKLKNGTGENTVRVLAAVDDIKTKNLLKKFESQCDIILTSPSLPSGTDRVAEAVRFYLGEHSEARRSLKGIVNLQGDTPFAGIDGLEAVIDYFIESDETALQKNPMVTLSEDWSEKTKMNDFSKVKVITKQNREALYFSRFAIPYSREKKKLPREPYAMEMHLGVYGYTLSTLFKILSASPTLLERLEGLEQLRALWLGVPILVFKTEARKGESFAGIDTPQDLAWARNFIKKRH